MNWGQKECMFSVFQTMAERWTLRERQHRLLTPASTSCRYSYFTMRENLEIPS